MLPQIFDALINSYVEEQVGIAAQFLSPDLAGRLRNRLLSLHSTHALLTAGTGNKAGVTFNPAVRNDRICWLHREGADAHELDFFRLMDAFVLHLNATCYTGITGYEFHYALYEAGSFYKKHLDQFRNDGRRKFSMILYLNPGWQAADGGELCVHTEAGTRHIAPEEGTAVFFKSDALEHEVLVANKARMSVTGWLKVD